MDIDHVTLTRDEQRPLFNLVNTVTRRYTSNILQLSLRRLNFVNEPRTQIQPIQYVAYVDQMILLDLHLVRVQFQDRREKITFSCSFSLQMLTEFDVFEVSVFVDAL